VKTDSEKIVRHSLA